MGYVRRRVPWRVRHRAQRRDAGNQSPPPLLEFGKDADPESIEFINRLKDLGNLEYFTFKISTKNEEDVLSCGITDEQEFYERLEYFMDHAQTDFCLISDDDTLQCKLYHFERTYGLSPNTNIILGFQRPSTTNSNYCIVYNDRILGIGPIRMEYSIDDLKNIPLLK